MGLVSTRLGQKHTTISFRNFDAKRHYEILRRNYRLTLADLRENGAGCKCIVLPDDSTLGKLVKFLNQFNA